MKIIYATAQWCAPCKALGPIVKKIQEEIADLTIVKVDIDADPALAETYNVRAVPTLIFLSNTDEEKGRLVGLQSKAKIVETLTNALMEPANDNKV